MGYAKKKAPCARVEVERRRREREKELLELVDPNCWYAGSI